MKHQPQDPAGLRAEGQTKTDLGLTCAHGLRDDAVEPNGGEHEGESAEEAREHCDEPLLCGICGDELIEGPENERDGRLGSRECGSDIALHCRSLAAIRVDGQDDGFPEWLDL